MVQRTNTVVAKRLESSSDILGVALAGLVGDSTGAEARSVAPAANCHADLGSLVKEGPYLIKGHKRRVRAAPVEGGGGRKSSNDIVDASSDILGGESSLVPSTFVSL